MREIGSESRMSHEPKDGRQLNAHLENRSDDGCPRQRDDEIDLSVPRSKKQERPDHREVPEDRGGVRQKELTMAVQDPETPRAQYEHGGAGEEDPGQPHREVELRPLESSDDRLG